MQPLCQVGNTVTFVQPRQAAPSSSLAHALSLMHVRERGPDVRPCWDISFVKLIVDNKLDVFCSSLPWGMRSLRGWRGPASPSRGVFPQDAQGGIP